MKANEYTAAIDKAIDLWREGYRPVLVNGNSVHMRPLVAGSSSSDIFIAELKTYYQAVKFSGDIRSAGLKAKREK